MGLAPKAVAESRSSFIISCITLLSRTGNISANFTRRFVDKRTVR